VAEALLLDGGLGTALIAAGLPAGALPEEWVRDRPEQVRAVHRAHAAAGARVLLTCTFNLAAPRLGDCGLGDQVASLAAAAVGLARTAAPGVRVAGTLGPSALVGPGGRGRPSAATMRDWYASAFRSLAAGGADLLWTESHWDLPEARAALAAALATGLPAVASVTPASTEGGLALADGTPAEEAVRALAADGALAAGVNCLLPGADLAGLAAALSDLPVPFLVKPSAGLPGALLDPRQFARWVAGAVRAGARWAGGCCGTGPEHLAALAQEARG